jgi:DNA-directed RNA polymerase specialized sigma24 family protein
MNKEVLIPEHEEKVSRNRHVTSEAFTSLLKALGDTPPGGTGYEQLRSKLIFFFSRRFLLFPEDLADEVLDRLAYRLSQGAEIVAVEAFALGIARHVVQEQARSEKQTLRVAPGFLDNIPAPPATQSNEEEIVRMEGCLRKLPAPEARLLRGYYLSSANDLIQARKNLAEKLGLSPTALRQRVFLARQRLRDCMMTADQKRRK